MDANIEISRFHNYFFNDALSNDMIYYTSSSNQHMLFGTESNALSVINMTACNVKVNRKLYVGAVQPYAPLLAQLEIADGGSNNQFIIYESSNNKQGLYINSSNGEAKVGAYDWTLNQPLHMLLQQTGSNLGIGMGISNPISLVHIKDNTTSNNILIEAGRQSDAVAEGFSAINFNGYTSNGDQRISTNKQRWRVKVDQTATNDYMGFDSYNGTIEYDYIILSNQNIGVNTKNPVGRFHITGETQDGTGDMTNSSNHPLTIQDTSGNPMRIIHLSSSALTSTIYNYQSTKNIYWGESSDLGMYAFQGRFVAIQSNLSIGHSNPTTLLHMQSNSSNIIKFTNSSNNQGIYLGIENASDSNGGGGLLWNASNAHLKFGTNNVERARLMSTGKLIIGSVSTSNALNQEALLEIADGGSNNQFIIYDNSNNRLGLSLFTSNNVSRITSYNWSTSAPIHLTLQNRGSNVGIGKDITNPLGLLHLRNDTSNNNVIIEAGRTSDGLNDGFSAINFNGYSSNNHKRINTLKNGWRIKVDQTGTNEAFSIEELKAATSNTYITLSNVNVGISNLNPSARLHVRAQTLDGALTDKTDSSNNPLTLEDNSGSAMRVVHLNTNSTVSTIYNYQQSKNIYWGESNDNGLYVFRGRRVSLLSNLGVNTLNPQERMVLNSGNLYISTSGNIVTDNQLEINTSNQNIIINAVNALGNISLRTGNIERAKVTSTGIFAVMSNISIGTSNPPANTILYAVSNSAGRIAATLENTSTSTSAFTEFTLLNNAGTSAALSLYLNNVTNTTTDGGASNATLKNNCGNLRLASINNNSLINLQSNGDITMSNNLFLTGALKITGPYSSIPANTPLYISSNLANGSTFSYDNPNASSTSFTQIRLTTDTGICSLFLNSSTRTSDGPANSTTLRSDRGVLRLSSSNNNAYLYLDPATSNIGVNTLSPLFTLDVKGSINSSNHIFTNNIMRITSNGILSNVTISGNFIDRGTVAVNYGGTGANTLAANKLIVGQGTGTVLQPTELHWNNSLIRLGIGNTSPASTLDVNGTISTGGTARLTSTGALQNITTLSANTVSATTYTGLPTASTSASGIVQLVDSVSSTSTTLAPTANSVKTAYDTALSAASVAVQKTGDTMTGNLTITTTNPSLRTTLALQYGTNGIFNLQQINTGIGIIENFGGEIHTYSRDTIFFFTKPDNVNNIQRMRIEKAGNVVFGGYVIIPNGRWGSFEHYTDPYGYHVIQHSTNSGIGGNLKVKGDGLDVYGTRFNAQVTFEQQANQYNTWSIKGPITGGGPAGGGNVLGFQYSAYYRGYLASDVDQGVIDFTGQHRSYCQDDFIGKEHVGLIVESKGIYDNLSSSENITINEALPIVELSKSRKSKRVYGVISDKEDNEKERDYKVGAWVTVLQKENNKQYLIINSIGEGGIWVCNLNGNLENGDYITSSDLAGYGMKQDEEVQCNFTVAKITCDCDFDNLPSWMETREISQNGTVYKCAFVGCTYHCG